MIRSRCAILGTGPDALVCDPSGFLFSNPDVPYWYLIRMFQDLIRMAYTQKVQLEKKDTYITEMESYLDNLLVRVIETSPTILQNPYEKKSSPVSQTKQQCVLQRPLLRTGKVTLPGTTPRPVTANTVVPSRTKGTNRTVPPKVVTHSRKAVKPNALKNPKKSLANPFKKISAALK